MEIPISDEALRLRVLETNDSIGIMKRTTVESNDLTVYYHENGWSGSDLEVGKERITVHNSSTKDIVIVLERADWSNDAITAAKVTAMQEFRDLFSSEVLSPNQQVGVEHVTILFSDLQGSTSLYESIGDANAYGQVRKHFDFLTYWISKNGGSVVKTIGDAIMAVFHLPEDGLKAALEIQKHVSEFNQNSAENIVLKIGLYSGPAIAVNSNNRLDYFGRTVNIAARIQGQSTGNDIVFSSNYLQKESIRLELNKENMEWQPFETVLKGIDGKVDLIRLTIKF